MSTAPTLPAATLLPNEMVINGHLVYRHMRRCQTTRAPMRFWATGPVPAVYDGPRLVQSEAPAWSSPWVCDAARLREIMQGIRHSRFVRPGDESGPLASELEKLRASGLESTAEMLSSSAKFQPTPPVAGLFSAGETYVSNELWNAGIGRQAVEDLLFRHVGGDLGNLGRVDPAEVTPEAEFCPIFAVPPAVRAAVAIKDGAGIVASAYPVGIDRRPGRPNMQVTAAIVTVLDARGNLTLVSEMDERATSILG